MTGSSSPKRLVATGLAHSFPGTGDLFTGLDLDLHPGEVVALVGSSRFVVIRAC